jgi:O-antigen/teichoic acid export membrane protein
MDDNRWQSIWQETQHEPHKRAIVSLMLLNGLSLARIRRLDDATLDLDQGWITTYDGATLPLVDASVDALNELAAADINTMDWHAACQAYEPFEDNAHRRLSGAIWITDPELQLTLETTDSTQPPILPLRFTFPFSVVDRLQPGETSEVAEHARQVLDRAAEWLITQTLEVQASLLRRLLDIMRQGSLIFLIASTGVSALNMVHNVIMGRLLSPADYSQLTFIITLQLLIGLVPTTLQTVVARFAARYEAQDDTGLLRLLNRRSRRFSWQLGLVVGACILVLSPLLVNLFQLDGMGLLLPIIIVTPFFVSMGTDRGLVQGIGGYFWLSGAYLSEGIIRLVLSVLLGYALVEAGRSLDGAIWGVAQSMLATWFITWLAVRHFATQSAPDTDSNRRHDQNEWVALGSMTALVLIGQALITNSDFLLVKNLFSPSDAGLYAAVSVLGRIVYFGALPLTVVLVPLIARRQALDQPTRPILLLIIGGGIAICSVLILGAAMFAGDILGLLYGDEYVGAASLLAPYALAASLYTLTGLVITYQIALGSGGETWMPILAGIAQIIGILLFHESLAQVITIQVILMGLLFGLVLWRVLRSTDLDPDADLLIAPAAG